MKIKYGEGDMRSVDILWQLLLIFFAARLAGALFVQLHQPAVVGELLVGILLGPQVLGWVQSTEFLSVLAELGVIFLLFQVGLESEIGEFKKVGRPAVVVGTFGVFVPFILGFSAMLLLSYPLPESLFIAAAMVATSVGITARALQEGNLCRTFSARIILAAAVFDDILGLLVLGFAVGLARGQPDWVSLGILLAETLIFVIFLVFFAPRLAYRHFPALERLPRSSAPFGAAVILCLGLSFLSSYIGLAAIIGAFLAGLALAGVKSPKSGAQVLRKQFEPLTELLAPFFFVMMGTHVDLEAFLQPSVLSLLALVLFLAILGKIIGSFIGTFRLGRKISWQVGIGMVPRGEVGLIVASIGLGIGALSPDLYSVVVAMSILTTLLAPPFLRRAFLSKPSPDPKEDNGTMGVDAADIPAEKIAFTPEKDQENDYQTQANPNQLHH